MSSESRYVVTVSDRTTLLRGPLGAALMLAALADRYGLELDLASIPRLAAAYGLKLA